jgi:hypothetical protein
MRELRMTLPELALIGATRAALGAGLALLLADRLPRDRRVAMGWTLAAIGALSTIPLAFEVFGRDRLAGDESSSHNAEAGPLYTAHGALRPSKSFVW